MRATRQRYYVYAEADQSPAGHRANDVVAVSNRGVPFRALTVANDEPDTRGLVVSDHPLRLDGLSANVVSTGDDYADRDTFLIAMGGRTNELAIRLDWPGDPADLDVLLFPAGEVEEIAAGVVEATAADELVVTAVAPSSSYWLWVGARKTVSTDLPTTYSLSLCGAQFDGN